jgi:hypothetical protein
MKESESVKEKEVKKKKKTIKKNKKERKEIIKIIKINKSLKTANKGGHKKKEGQCLIAYHRKGKKL